MATSRLGQLGFALLFSLLLATSGGCGSDSVTDKVKEYANAMQTLNVSLSMIYTVDDMETQLPQLRQDLDRTVAASRDFAANAKKIASARVSKSSADRLNRGIGRAVDDFNRQCDRIQGVRGGPAEFWEAFHLARCEIAVASVVPAEMMLEESPDEFSEEVDPDLVKAVGTHMRHELEMRKEHGSARVVRVQLKGRATSRYDEIRGRIESAVPDSNTDFVDIGTEPWFLVCPVEDFQVLLTALEPSGIKFEDKAMGMIKLDDVIRSQSGSVDADFDSLPPEMAEFIKGNDMRGARPSASRDSSSSFGPGRNEEPEPTEGTPEYYDWLVEQMGSDNVFEQREAIKELMKIRPEDVASKETRSTIAKAFRDLAFEGNSFEQEDAIKGLVRWGGTYSVPILLDLFAEADSHDRDPLYRAFGDLKDPRAARAVASKLGDFFEGDEAYRCLERMGAAAEEALIEVAPSNDSDVCVAAIRLLGLYGTEKCMPILRKANSSRNPAVRNVAKMAVTQVQGRVGE